jgi:predicted permease
MTTLLQDLRHGVRLLAKSPGFAVAAILVLALGIGANTAIFSIVQGVLLEPLPFPHPERLVLVWHTPPPDAFPGMKTFSVSTANYLDWKRENHSFEGMAISGYAGLALTGSGEPESIPAARVSSEFFSVFGAKPALGRTFTAAEDQPGADRVIVLSHQLWKTRFGGDASIVGREIRLNDQPYRVLGVMGPEMRIPDFSRAWVPTGFDAEARAVRNNHNFLVYARLKPGVDIPRATAEMTLISERLAKQYPEDDAGWGAVVHGLRDDMVGDVRPLLLVLLGAVAFVLLIACANVANLMLARTFARRKEIAIRSALGADRGRLLRQLIAESLLLSIIGGALGLFLASFGMKGMVALLGDEIPRTAVVAMNGAVLAYTLVVSVVTGILAGLAPAWRGTATNLADSLKQGLGRTDSAGEGRKTRNALIVSEVALSLVLLIGAGLMIRTLWALRNVDPGFDSKNVTTIALGLSHAKYEDKDRLRTFVHGVLERMAALPGVESAGSTNSMPLTGTSNWPIQIEGRPPLPVSQQPNVVTSTIAGDYLKTMRIPVKRGRAFTTADRAEAPGVILISEAMAKRFWPSEDPIGKRLVAAFAAEKPREVVGIVGDVKFHGLENREPVAAMYVPYDQIPSRGMAFAIRARGQGNVASAAVAAVHAVDPGQPVQQVAPMDQLVAESLSRQRFGMLLLGSFAALALVLAAIGIYSVLSYAVRHRGREIGIRMALGAQMSDVLKLIVAQGMKPALLGMAIGLAGALGLTRLLSSLVYGVKPSDPWTFASVAALLGAVALSACLVPALRASRVDPLQSLRDD